MEMDPEAGQCSYRAVAPKMMLKEQVGLIEENINLDLNLGQQDNIFYIEEINIQLQACDDLKRRYKPIFSVSDIGHLKAGRGNYCLFCKSNYDDI